MMTHEESIAEAKRLLTEAGSKRVEVRGSHPFWLVACDWGTSATSDEDHTMDEPHECAAALVAARGEPAQIPADEADSVVIAEETPVAGPPADDGGVLKGNAGGTGTLDAEAEAAVAVPPDSADDGAAADLVGAEPADATFLEIAAEGADLDPLALPAPDPADFDPDEIAPVDEVAEAVAIFGDNLPMQRLLLIGAVTRHAAQLKAILQDGWTLDEFRSLQNLVVRIDRGEATDDPLARARFQAISEASRAMSAIDSYAEAQVAFLEGATREQIEGYQVDQGWP